MKRVLRGIFACGIGFCAGYALGQTFGIVGIISAAPVGLALGFVVTRINTLDD